MTTSTLQQTSTALRANLAQTRCQVVIPPAYAPLLEAVAPYVGVHAATGKVLAEYFHPLRALDAVVTDLATLVESKFSYFADGPDAARSAELLVSLFLELNPLDLSPEVRRRLLRGALDFLVQLHELPGDAAGRLLDLVADCLTRHGHLLFQASTFLRTVGGTLGSTGPLALSFRSLYRSHMLSSLDLLHGHLTTRDDAERVPPWPLPLVERVHRELTRAREALAGADEGALYDLPTLDDAVDSVLAAVSALGDPVERIHCCMRLAALPELEYRYRDVQQDLDRALGELLEGGGGEEILPVVRALTGWLRRCPPEQKGPLFTTVERLGRGLAGPAHRAVREVFIDRLVAEGFEEPDVAGVTDEWQVRVNPFHLPYVRVWLAVIESDPGGYERLLSALVVNLHLRGIFVSDTDLFQRDVTALLASGTADVFNLVLQLLAVVPVFFNDIGSEGELREVSTRLDQLTERGDVLTHFLRKACHAEPNNRLILFAEAVLLYWMSGDPGPLAPYVPEGLLARLPQDGLPWYDGARAAVAHLTGPCGFTLVDLLERLSYDELGAALAPFDGATESQKERVVLLVRLRRLLSAKYSSGSEELHDVLSRSPAVDPVLAGRFRTACAADDSWGVVLEGTRVMAALKTVVTTPGPAEAYEDIYYKRHIAAGIPSMYGTYREARFDALGQLFRVQALLRPHLERLTAHLDVALATKTNLLMAYRLMRVMLGGLEVAGLRVDNLSSKVELVKRSLWVGTFSATQFLNVVEFVSAALGDVIDANYIGVHEDNVRRIGRQVAAERGVPEAEVCERADGMAEGFLRSLIAGTYALQDFDRFAGALRRSLRAMTERLDEDGCRLLLNYSQDKLVSFIHRPLGDHEDQLVLGAKGLTLKKLRGLDLPVPEGFILSTELFAIKPIMGFPQLRKDTDERIRAALAALETDTGRRLGDPQRPLLVSVRSGAAISMPGMMDTVINVGLTRELAEAWARDPARAWTAWDCYRRYVQSHAMSRGVDRNRFDALILDFKTRHEAERKLDLSPAQMREVALAYESLAAEAGVAVPQDAVEQILSAVDGVLGSWEAPTARAYRRELELSEGWGTAVIVQRMVLGNLGPAAGTGAFFTTDPRSPSARVELFGDFVSCSQGEDVVAGLVHPLPLSEKQRLRYAAHLSQSLERLAPAIFGRLVELATHLVRERGFEHQEMEFTFESADPSDLFILQSRPMTGHRPQDQAVFCGGDELDGSRAGSGVGVAGGALSGRAAFTETDVARLRLENPDAPIILLRPDTVPEDIPRIMSVDGLLTARGGVTSHASVTAKRLGLPCVVNCRELAVQDEQSQARLGSTVLRPGDWLSIDGVTGAVFLGEHDIRTARRALRLV